MRLVITHWALGTGLDNFGHWLDCTGQWDTHTSLHCFVSSQGFPSFSVSRTLILKGLSCLVLDIVCNLFVDIKGDISISYLVIVIVQDTVFS